MDLWTETRTARKIPGLLGLEAHPEVVAMASATCDRPKWVGLLQKILYRADLEAQFVNFPEARVGHDGLQKKQEKAATQQQLAIAGKPDRLRLTETTICKMAFIRHVRDSTDLTVSPSAISKHCH
eukprot:5942575-Lingulodinium_polyedra.AAC.1